VSYHRLRQFAEEVERDIEQTLERWHFAASAEGLLWMQPADRVLQFSELAFVIKRLIRASRFSSVRFIELDLSGVTIVGAPITSTILLLNELHRRLSPRCRISEPVYRQRPAADVLDAGAIRLAKCG
jgi:hypothetical protein